MPYVLPATFDTLPRALRISPAERAANSSSAPLPGVPRRARTHLPANVRGGFTYGTPSQNEHGPSTSAASSSPGSLTPTPADMLALASPTTALLHVSQSTPLPCLALPRARRVRREADVVFPCAEPDASANAYVLAPPEPKHQPINGKNGLRLSLDAIKATLAGNTEPRPKPTTTATTPTPSLRKKSGELVKPSLKHAHTLSGGLPTQKSMSMSRSMPTTPTTPKFVHFDAQLEHVRLFLAEQKPTAVSRDGSPTETSEGEGNEFPWNGRGYGSSDDERAKKSLRVKSTNVPPCSSLDGSDVRVQSLTLSEDGSFLVGRVLVRNLAFEKWVAARFTFDLWQTTSEVSARYIDTVADGVDRFGFTIKLGDVMHRIEEKTLFVAVRYTVAGREIWDSNHGQNYMVSFTKQANSNGWSTKSRTRDQMSDLRKSLERAIQDDDDSVPQLQIKSRPRPSVRGMSFSGFEKPSVASIVGKQEPKPAKFGARYDFGAAPRERPSADAFRMPELRRPEPKPAKRPAVSTEVPRPIAKLCESPRDAEDMVGLRMVEPLVRSNGLELPSPADPVPIPRRHHHRASYFDAWTFPAPGVKRTASGPAVEDESKDMGIPASWMAGADMGADLFGGSVASTPSVTSASSPSQSPSSPPEFLPSPEIIDAEIDLGCGPKAVEPHNPNMNYSSFLDQFCFFTGPRPADNFTRPSDDYMYGGYSDATARTLRAVSSSLSNCSSDASASNTPRAGSPAHLARAGSPASSDSAH